MPLVVCLLLGPYYMPCFHPLPAVHDGFNPSGKKHFRFLKGGYKKALQDFEVDTVTLMPCGQCVDCRLERSRQWAVRCMHEAQFHESNCFITLTYNDEHLPEDRSLHLEDFQKFMKRLRKKFGNGIRYYHCGEYGDLDMRPHYHACLFGFRPDDLRYWKKTKAGSKLYRSPSIEKLWTDPKTGESLGFSSIGDVTFESAAYVARYIMKKINGKKADEIDPVTGLRHYEYLCENTGEVIDRKPEYTTMSRRPGIGSMWFDKYNADVYPSDTVVVRGKEYRPPKAYDVKLEKLDFDLYSMIKEERVKRAKEFSSDNTPERLSVREKVKTSRLQLFNRRME